MYKKVVLFLVAVSFFKNNNPASAIEIDARSSSINSTDSSRRNNHRHSVSSNNHEITALSCAAGKIVSGLALDCYKKIQDEKNRTRVELSAFENHLDNLFGSFGGDLASRSFLSTPISSSVVSYDGNYSFLVQMIEAFAKDIEALPKKGLSPSLACLSRCLEEIKFVSDFLNPENEHRLSESKVYQSALLFYKEFEKTMSSSCRGDLKKLLNDYRKMQSGQGRIHSSQGFKSRFRILRGIQNTITLLGNFLDRIIYPFRSLKNTIYDNTFGFGSYGFAKRYILFLLEQVRLNIVGSLKVKMPSSGSHFCR